RVNFRRVLRAVLLGQGHLGQGHANQRLCRHVRRHPSSCFWHFTIRWSSRNRGKVWLWNRRRGRGRGWYSRCFDPRLFRSRCLSSFGGLLQCRFCLYFRRLRLGLHQCLDLFPQSFHFLLQIRCVLLRGGRGFLGRILHSRLRGSH